MVGDNRKSQKKHHRAMTVASRRKLKSQRRGGRNHVRIAQNAEHGEHVNANGNPEEELVPRLISGDCAIKGIHDHVSSKRRSSQRHHHERSRAKREETWTRLWHAAAASDATVSRDHSVRSGSRRHHHHHGKRHKKCRRHRHRRHRDRRRRQPVEHINPWIKCLIFSFNFFFWLLGCGVAALGFWIMTEKNKNIRDILDVVFDPSILMCTAGCIIFTIGFFGCLGALRENIYLLKSFHVLLTVMLVLELLVGVWVLVFYYVPDARDWLGVLEPRDTLTQAIVRYRDDDDLRDLIDNIQREFQCCGVSNSDFGYRDWQENMYFNCSADNPSVERCGVPQSCCKLNVDEMTNVMCGFDTTHQESPDVSHKINVQGCLKGFGAWLERNTIIIGAVFLGILVPQLMGICLARSFIEQINQQKGQWKYTSPEHL